MKRVGTSSELFIDHCSDIDNDYLASPMCLKLVDSRGHNIASFFIHNMTVTEFEVHTNDTHIVHDNVSDKIHTNLIGRLIGLTLPKCNETCVVVHNDCVIGKIKIDGVKNKLHLNFKQSYQWQMYKYSQSQSRRMKACMEDEDTKMLLDVLGISLKNANDDLLLDTFTPNNVTRTNFAYMRSWSM